MTEKRHAPSCPLRTLTSDFALDAMAESSQKARDRPGSHDERSVPRRVLSEPPHIDDRLACVLRMSSDGDKIKTADQVIRSGIAGGVAGCVVRNAHFYVPVPLQVQLTSEPPTFLGKDGRCAARPCQDPLSGLKS